MTGKAMNGDALNGNAMTDDRFIALMNAHGADLSRWPGAERPAAERLLAESETARIAWRAARAVDHQLAVPPRVDDARVGRLVAAVARRARETPRETLVLLLFGRMPARLAGALCAGLLLLGWVLGGVAPRPAARAGTDVALLADDVPTLYDGGGR